MDRSTSSAQPSKLFHYSTVTVQIDDRLVQESQRLAGHLQDFEATCKEEPIRVSFLADKLLDYGQRAKETDLWVSDIATEFELADTGTIRSDSPEGDSFWDGVQGVLDGAGLVPGIGEPADLASGIISAARGDWAGAGLSALSLIPTGGQAAGAAKLARRAKRLENGLSTAENWGDLSKLERHFRDHGEDFGAKSADEYAGMASDFLKRSQAEDHPTKIASDGTIRVWDPDTNTFGAFNPDGTTKTFFKPKSPTYWERQPGTPPIILDGGKK